MPDIQVWIKRNIQKRSSKWAPRKADSGEYIDYAKLHIPHSDLTAAREIFACFEHLIHYVPDLNQWHVWNEIYHEKVDGDLLARWMCYSMIDWHRKRLSEVKEHYVAQASALTTAALKKQKMDEYTKDFFKDHRDYRDRIHNNAGIEGLVNQIKRLFSVESSFFNDDRKWLVLQNGVIDLDELRRRPPAPGDLAGIPLLDHDPARPVWRAVNASLQPGLDSNRWLGFLSSSQPDPELRRFLAVAVGAAFLAESKTKIIPVLKGPRDCGKTVFLDTINTFAGGYGGEPDTSALNKANGPNFEQDQFRGLRFVGVSEPDTDRKVDDSFLKKFTGGDTLSTRNLHAKSVAWKSQGILFCATNSDLKFNTTDNAILTRFATVTFPHQFFPPGQVPVGKEAYEWDQTLEIDLKREFDGILTWVLNGMLVYLHEGIKVPTAVEAVRRQQFVEGNTVVNWFENRVKNGDSEGFTYDPSPGRPNTHYVPLSDAHMAYCAWTIGELGVEAEGKRRFSQAIQDLVGLPLVKSGEYRVPRLVRSDIIESEKLSKRV